MQFNSYLFFIFFFIVLALHYSSLSWRTKKFNLPAASYLFYAAWNPPFVILIWISTLVDWFAAKALASNDDQRQRRILLFVSLIPNLGLLGFFKYTEFFLYNLSQILELAGIYFRPVKMDIVLPIGISFYTFQTLSYTFDVYLKRARPWHSFLDYALYVTFFPQLIAGPIVRSGAFLPQCAEPRKASGNQLGYGLTLLVLGIFQKNVVADGLLAPLADKIYRTNISSVGIWDAWAGTLAFAGQIFCDFAGYSTCAVGVALCLGFELPNNFHFPYAAVGFADFWRRWHISLSSWLKDYLYIPLGGNARGKARTFLNLAVTMLICGLWHGASWTFVVWGGLHGAYLVAEHLLKRWIGHLSVWKTKSIRFVLGLATFALVCLAYVFFRSRSLSQAFMVSKAMLGFSSKLSELSFYKSGIIVVTISSMLVLHWFMRSKELSDVIARRLWWQRAVVISLMLTAIVLLPGGDNAFIYFQF